MATMCDRKSLDWCGRITLLLTICGILCVMMFQIWSYYYSLVTQMDEIVLESPQVHGVLDVCETTVKRSWNVDSCRVDDAILRCVLAHDMQDVFVNTVGSGEVSVNGTTLSISPATACVRVMLWILPW